MTFDPDKYLESKNAADAKGSFDPDAYLKKKDGSEISSEELPSQDLEQTSTSPTNELIQTAEVEGKQRPPLSIQEQKEFERPPEGIKEEPKPEFKMEDIMKDVRGEDIFAIVKSATEGIENPRDKAFIGGAVGLVEAQWKAGGTLSPGARMMEYSKAIAPIEAEYLESFDEYPTEEQRDNYLKKLEIVADDLGMGFENGAPVVDNQTKENYAKSLEFAQAKMDPEYGKAQIGSFGKDVVNQVASGSSRLYANTLDLMGWAVALNAIPGYESLAEGQKFREEQFKDQVERKDQGIIDAVNEGEYSKALGNTILQFSESVPTLITLAMGNAAGYGNASLAYMGATEGTGRYRELEDEDMPEVAKIFNSIVWGAAEAIPEKFGTAAVMQSSMAALKRGVKKEAVGDIIKQGFSSQAHKYTAMAANGMNVAVRGGIDEWSTAVTQNILDSKENPLEGTGDAFLVGVFTDVAMSSPVLAVESISAAKDIASEITSRLPKTMPVDDKIRAGKILIEKDAVQSVNENLDDSFKNTNEDVVSDLDNSAKLTTLGKEDKYTASEINKFINEELTKKNPNPETLVSLNNKLSNIESKSGAVIDKANQSVVDKALKGNTPSEVISTMQSIQENRNGAYVRAWGKIDNKFSDIVDKEAKQKASENANEALEATKQEQVDEAPTKEPKELKTTQKQEETPSPIESESKPKTETNEKDLQEQTKTKESDSKKDTKESIGKEKVLKESSSGIKETKKVKVIPEEVSLKTVKTKKSGKMTAEAFGETVETKDIVVKGEVVGEVQAGMFEKDIRLNNIRLEEGSKGIGAGKEAYRSLNQEANSRGGVLVSSETISDDAGYVWKSLVKSGEAEKVGDVYKFKSKEVVDSTTDNTSKISEEITKKVGKLETLDAKKKKAIQSAAERAARLGNISFALDDVGKKQAIDDIIGLSKDLVEAGFISAEIGAVKTVDAIKAFLADKNPKSGKFIDENRAEIQKILDKEVEKAMKPPVPPKETTSKKTQEPKRKERRLGRKALDSTKLPDEMKENLSVHGIEYSVKGKKVTDAEAKAIADAYIENDRVDELKSVIMDTKNDIPGDTRTNLAVGFVNKTLALAETAETASDRKAYMQDALDVFEMDMVESTGQAQALQSKRMWADVIASNPDLFVDTVRRRQRRDNQKTLEGRSEDIKTAKQVIDEFLQSDEFKRISEEKGRAAFDKILDQGKNSRERVERGKAKMASGLSQIASLVGAKKNAVSENETSPEIIKAVVEIADGILDVGIGSTAKLITKIKVMLREHLSPNEIDKITPEILKETKANRRIQKPKQKKNILTEAELKKLVDSLYSKMASGTKDQARTLARDYLDRLNEGGALDEQSFKDLFAKSLGLDYLDAKSEAKLREMAEKLSDMRSIGENLNSLFNKLKNLNTELNLAKKKGVTVPDLQKQFDKVKAEVDTQIKAYEQSMKDAKIANADISDMFAKDLTTADLMATFIQGNLLTPISLVTNVVANTAWLPFRGVKNVSMHLADMALYRVGGIKENLLKKYGEENPWVRRKLDKLPDKKRTVDYIAYSKGYLTGIKLGLKEGLSQMKTGQLPEDAYIREVGKGLDPIKAWVDNIASLKGTDKIKAMKFFNNAIEGTFGIPPEIMFRLLNLGDKPFRRAAERGRLNEMASLRGLKGVEKDQFMQFPPDDVLDEMRQAGLESTYQQDNVISDFILHGAKKGKSKTIKDAKKAIENFDKATLGVGRLLVKTQIPYVKTPTNIVLETIDYAMPMVSLSRSVYHALNGDRRKAVEYASKAAVGFMIDAAVVSMMSAGIMTLAPQGLEEDDKSSARTKIRESEYLSGQEPYMININALARWLVGGDPKWKSDEDMLLSYKRFGIMSAFMMSRAESFRGKTPEEIKETGFIDKRLSSFVPMIKSSVDQSFLAGISSGMNAITQGGYAMDSWFVNTARAFSSTAIPNTYVAVNQYRDTVIRETKNKSLKGIDRNLDELKRTFKANLTTDSGLPVKVTVWGDPVNRVPDGRGIGYILFDLTKARKYNSTFGSKLHDLYMETGDPKVLPSQPSKTYKFNEQNIKLTPELYEKLQVEIGSNRKLMVEPLVNSSIWDTFPNDQKTYNLDVLYKMVTKTNPVVKAKFEAENFSRLFKMSQEKAREKQN